MRNILTGMLWAALACAQNVTFERIGMDWGPGIVLNGDFNRDGRNDLLQVTNTAILTRLSNADGTFQDAIRTPLLTAVNAVVVADFNHDGVLDVVAASPAEPVAHIFAGDGKGGFAAGAVLVGLPRSTDMFVTRTWIDSMVATDLNGDGRVDLMVQVMEQYGFFYAEGTFYALMAGRDGSLQPGTPYYWELPWTLFAMSDLNRDGKPDLIAAPPGAKPFIKLGTGAGTFRDGPVVPIEQTEISAVYSGMASGDFNADGITDLAIPVKGAIAVLLGKGDGSFAERVRIPIDPTSQIWNVDLNGDGFADLLLHGRSRQIILLPGKGDGTFGDAQVIDEDSNRIEAIADVDGDGRPDLVVPQPVDRPFLILLNRTPASLRSVPVSSAAGTVTGGIAPQMLISIYGSFLADPSAPERTKVRINGSELKLLYVSAAQINAYAGSLDGPPGAGKLEVLSPAGVLQAEINVVDYAPAIFLLDQNSGAGLFHHSDGTLVTADSPARAGESITVLCTGLGRMAEAPEIRVGGVKSAVRSVGTDPQASMANTVEFVVPGFAIGRAMYPLQLMIAGVASNEVTIPIE